MTSLVSGANAATASLSQCARRGITPSSSRLGDRSPADRPRRLKPGTVLVREYQGERHTVTVVADGFRWGDSMYRTLTTIARAITGTAWSGPRFFGVRPNLNGMRDVDSEREVTSVRTADAGPATVSSRR